VTTKPEDILSFVDGVDPVRLPDDDGPWRIRATHSVSRNQTSSDFRFGFAVCMGSERILWMEMFDPGMSSEDLKSVLTIKFLSLKLFLEERGVQGVLPGHLEQIFEMVLKARKAAAIVVMERLVKGLYPMVGMDDVVRIWRNAEVQGILDQ
jgi:hypothetical protein